jgi:hypothetical protein
MKIFFVMICMGVLLFFSNSAVQVDGIADSSSGIDIPRTILDTIFDRLNAKGGPAALIRITTGDQWFKTNKGSLQAMGIKTLQVRPDQYGKVLNDLKKFYQKSSEYSRNNSKNILYIYPVSSHWFADKDFLELIAYHNVIFYQDGPHQFLYGDNARNQFLMKIAQEINSPKFENGMLNFIKWFDYLYHDFEGVIPASFTLYVPSKRKDDSSISEEEIDQVMLDFYNRIVKRFADGFSIFSAKGSWLLSQTGELQEEDVKMATVDYALDKTQIFATTLLLIVQAIEVRIQLDQDSVFVKVLSFPFFIGN